LKARTSFGKV